MNFTLGLSDDFMTSGLFVIFGIQWVFELPGQENPGILTGQLPREINARLVTCAILEEDEFCSQPAKQTAPFPVTSGFNTGSACFGA